MNNLTNEQKAHDLAVAFATYRISQMNKPCDVDDFYQEYELAFAAFDSLVKRNG